MEPADKEDLDQFAWDAILDIWAEYENEEIEVEDIGQRVLDILIARHQTRPQGDDVDPPWED